MSKHIRALITFACLWAIYFQVFSVAFFQKTETNTAHCTNQGAPLHRYTWKANCNQDPSQCPVSSPFIYLDLNDLNQFIKVTIVWLTRLMWQSISSPCPHHKTPLNSSTEGELNLHRQHVSRVFTHVVSQNVTSVLSVTASICSPMSSSHVAISCSGKLRYADVEIGSRHLVMAYVPSKKAWGHVGPGNEQICNSNVKWITVQWTLSKSVSTTIFRVTSCCKQELGSRQIKRWRLYKNSCGKNDFVGPKSRTPSKIFTFAKIMWLDCEQRSDEKNREFGG